MKKDKPSSVVEYRLPERLRNISVCLYNVADGHFTTQSLESYISNCHWQLSQGETVKRIPFHASASAVDCRRAIEDLQRIFQERKKAELGQMLSDAMARKTVAESP